jgi:hypothetical protein
VDILALTELQVQWDQQEMLVQLVSKAQQEMLDQQVTRVLQEFKARLVLLEPQA